MSGVERMRVSPIWYGLPNAPAHSAPNAATGLLPDATTISDPVTIASSTLISGVPTFCAATIQR
jgi:hypothetical protein